MLAENERKCDELLSRAARRSCRGGGAFHGRLRSRGGVVRFLSLALLILSIQPWAWGSLEYYNLPEGFREKLEARARIDHYPLEHYTTETNLEAVAYPAVPKRQQERKG